MVWNSRSEPSHGDTRVCFFAVPRVVLFTYNIELVQKRISAGLLVLLTLVANRREQSDSLRCAASGDRFRTIKVFEFPLSDVCKR